MLVNQNTCLDRFIGGLPCGIAKQTKIVRSIVKIRRLLVIKVSSTIVFEGILWCEAFSIYFIPFTVWNISKILITVPSLHTKCTPIYVSLMHNSVLNLKFRSKFTKSIAEFKSQHVKCDMGCGCPWQGLRPAPYPHSFSFYDASFEVMSEFVRVF